MAINVTLGEVKTQEEKPFPKLMISKHGRIVLFTQPSIGTVLFEKEKSWGIGYYSKSWDIQEFTDYNKPVTIQNA